MPRYYLRKLRADLGSQGGDGGVVTVAPDGGLPAGEPELGLPGGTAPAAAAPSPRRRRTRATEQTAVEAIMTEDVVAVAGVSAADATDEVNSPAAEPDVSEEIAVEAIMTEDVAAVVGASVADAAVEAEPATEGRDVSEQVAVDAIMTEDVASVTGVTETAEVRPRPRRRSRAAAAADAGVLPDDPGFTPEGAAAAASPAKRPTRRRTRAAAAEQTAVEAIMTEDVATVTGVSDAGATVVDEPGTLAEDVTEEVAVEAIMTEDVASVTGVTGEAETEEWISTEPGTEEQGWTAAEPGTEEQRHAGRRRRRRGRRGRDRQASETVAAETAGVLPGEPELPPETADLDDEYVPHLPPSAHLSAMVQTGGLVLPEPRGRRRGRGRGFDRKQDQGLPGANGSQTVEEPAARLPAAPSRGGRERSPLEDLIARQNVLFDDMMRKQTAMLQALERMMTVMERRGGAGGGGTAASIVSPQRVGVFVDVPNIVYAAERIGVDIDWGKVLHYLSRDRQVVRASAYAPVSDDRFQRIELQKFVEPFYKLPYRILTKPLKRFGNGEIKANFDVELAIDVITMADRLDIVCLVSGDGDFRRMVELVQSKGVRVEVVAFSSSTAGELRAVCDEYIDFSQHLHEFCMTK